MKVGYRESLLDFQPSTTEHLCGWPGCICTARRWEWACIRHWLYLPLDIQAAIKVASAACLRGDVGARLLYRRAVLRALHHASAHPDGVLESHACCPTET